MTYRKMLGASALFSLGATVASAGELVPEFTSRSGNGNGGLLLLLAVGAVLILNGVTRGGTATRNDTNYDTQEDQDDSIMKF